jgi:hypothetical protein
MSLAVVRRVVSVSGPFAANAARLIAMTAPSTAIGNNTPSRKLSSCSRTTPSTWSTVPTSYGVALRMASQPPAPSSSASTSG